LALTPDKNQNRADKLAVRHAAEQDVLMREVDEAVRREQIQRAARRYGLMAGGAIVLALLGLGGWLFWSEQRESELETRSENLVLAFDELEAGALKQADSELTPLAEEGSDATSVSANLARAAIALSENREDEAAQIFQAVADDAKAPEPYRQLAAIRLSAAQFDKVAPQVVIDRLKPIAVPGNPWFGSAGELVAMAYLKQGREDLAGPLLAGIARDKTVPETLRARSRQLAGLLGYDAIDEDDVALLEQTQQQGAAPAAAPGAAPTQ